MTNKSMRYGLLVLLAGLAFWSCGCSELKLMRGPKYRFAVLNKTDGPIALVLIDSDKVTGFVGPTLPNETKSGEWYCTRLPATFKVSWHTGDAKFSKDMKLAEALHAPKSGRILITIRGPNSVTLSQ